MDTWALGPLKPGRQKMFRWSVTAVRPGRYRITYRVAAGLDGKAKAVGVGGSAPAGLFIGHVEDEAPDTRIAEDGKTVIEGATSACKPSPDCVLGRSWLAHRRSLRPCHARFSALAARLFSYPGTRARDPRVLRERGSVLDRSHIENVLPRVLRISF